MRRNGFTIFSYLNNRLLIGRSYKEMQLATQFLIGFLIQILSSLGICVNHEKSNLTPTRSTNFIGATLGLTTTKAYLPIKRFHSRNNLIKQAFLRPRTSVRNYLSLLGCMASCTHVMPFVKLHPHCLQTWFQSIYSSEKVNISTKVTIMSKFLACLI